MKSKFLFIAVILTAFAFLALVALTGCASKKVEARPTTTDAETWALDPWKGNTTKFSQRVYLWDGTYIEENFSMYVFRCSENWAQITPDTYASEGAMVWVPRSVLVSDPCESGRMTGEGGAMLLPLQ